MLVVLKLSWITLLLFLCQHGAEAKKKGVSVGESAHHKCAAEAKKSVVCEGESAHLNCDLGFLKVIKANYGRTDCKTCASGKPASRISNKHCSTEAALSIMSNRCDGSKSCSVPALNSVFTDPCVGTSKYLDLSYNCIPAKRSVTCENSQSVIKCGKGVIHVHHANYGRRDLATCPHKLGKTTHCYSPQTSSLRSRCDGKKLCKLSASNSVFSDPCVNVNKYLEVTYRCKK